MSRPPIFHDNHVFVSSDYGTGCALLKLSADGAEEVYFNRDMRNHYSSSVLLDGVLYGYSSRILTAMNFKTGEVLWKDRSVGKGQVIFADGKLYLYSEDGRSGHGAGPRRKAIGSWPATKSAAATFGPGRCRWSPAASSSSATRIRPGPSIFGE